MDHAALNGPWTHDRHLDDEIVEAARSKAREHRHLGPALDLEHADRVRLAERVVDARILCGDARQPIDRAGPRLIRIVETRLGETERLANRREHPETEDVDLEEAERVQIVLIPRDHRSSGHRRRLDGGDVHQRLGAEHKAPDVDGQVARKSLYGARHPEHLANARVPRIESTGRDAVALDALELVPPSHEAAQTVHLL